MMTKKLLTAGLVTGMAAMNIVPAFAAVPTTSAQISKTFEVPDGVSSIDETFKFTATSNDAGAPTATINDLQFNTLGEKSNGKYSITKTSGITFTSTDPNKFAFPHAGKYTYTVKETAGTDSHITYDTVQYKMHVYVVNKNDGSLEIKQITADTPKTVNGVTNDEKVASMSFKNTYAATSNLTISKNVDGDYGDHTKAFTFHLTLNHGALDSTNTFTGKIGNEEKTFTAGTSTEFTLKHGQSLTFENLPVGTTYTVTEADDSDYTPSIKVNGTDVKNSTGTTDNVKEANGVVTDAANNTVAYTNTEKSITVTGVVMKNLPYLLLVAVGVIGMAFVMLSKSHKGSKE